MNSEYQTPPPIQTLNGCIFWFDNTTQYDTSNIPQLFIKLVKKDICQYLPYQSHYLEFIFHKYNIGAEYKNPS